MGELAFRKRGITNEQIEEFREKFLKDEETLKITWTEQTHSTYNWALWNISTYMDTHPDMDAFKASSALALVFNLWKEETLHDIIEFRKKHGFDGPEA